MIAALALGLVLGAGGTALATWLYRRRDRRRHRSRRVALPFSSASLSEPVLDAALRLSRAERATLVPVCLIRVPLAQSLDSAARAEAEAATAVLEAVEQRAARFGVPTDARLERGRDLRHALREFLSYAAFDRLVIPARTGGEDGLDPADVAWLLDNAPGEIVVLRAAPAKAADRVGGP